MFHILVGRQVAKIAKKCVGSATSRRRKLSPENESKNKQKCKRKRTRKDGRKWRWFFEDSDDDDDGGTSTQTESEIEGDVPDNGIENTVWGRLMMSPKGLFLSLLAFRLINSLLIQTSYVPDEYWQSLEVAHKMAFGYGYETWEWKNGLRGYTYPGVFALIFKLLEILHLDYRILIIRVPRLLQGTLAAVGDYYLYKFSSRLAGYKVAQWTLVCQLTSWFTFYCAPRTLTNSAETAISIVGLYYYPWTFRARDASWKFISMAALAVIVRPTAAVMWLPLCLCHLLVHRHWWKHLLKTYIIVGLVFFGLSACIDRVFYGTWTLVPYNFVKFNIGHGISSIYGTHPTHWYLTQGLPAILGPHFIPFCASVRRFMEPRLLPVLIFMVIVFSMLPHKEFRFLFPILPMAMHFCGRYLYYLHKMDIKDALRSLTKKSDDPVYENVNTTSLAHYCLVALAVTNVPIMLYSSLLHQRGAVDVMKYVSVEANKNPNMSALFLMPCHSTPYYSYVHQNISMRFLTCEPNLDRRENYTDEADKFYNTPNKWLKKVYPKGRGKPSHIVLFEDLEEKLSNFFEKYGYQTCASIFHTHMPDGRVSERILVKCLHKQSNVKRKFYQ